jgi:hypothetical protein
MEEAYEPLRVSHQCWVWQPLPLLPRPVPSLNHQCDHIQRFTEAGWFKRGFSTGQFKDAMDRSGEQINEYIKQLCLALQEGE